MGISMGRFMPLLGLAFACGCGPQGDASNHGPGVPEPVVDPAVNVSAFQFDEAKQIIYLDTQAPAGQRRQFGIGLGSITIETLRTTNNQLVFHYTPEVEGGYTTYECTIPVSPPPVEFRIKSDGTPGDTSFDLTKCKVVRRGNLLLEQ